MNRAIVAIAAACVVGFAACAPTATPPASSRPAVAEVPSAPPPAASAPRGDAAPACGKVDQDLTCRCRSRTSGDYESVPCDEGCQEGFASDRPFCSIALKGLNLRTAAVPLRGPSPAHPQGTAVLTTRATLDDPLVLTEVDLVTGARLRQLPLPGDATPSFPGSDLARTGPFTVVASSYDGPSDRGAQVVVVRTPDAGPFTVERRWSIDPLDTVSVAAESPIVVVAGKTAAPPTPPNAPKGVALQTYDLRTGRRLATRSLPHSDLTDQFLSRPVPVGLRDGHVLVGTHTADQRKGPVPSSSTYDLFRLPATTLKGTALHHAAIATPVYPPFIRSNAHGFVLHEQDGHLAPERTSVVEVATGDGPPHDSAAVREPGEDVFLGPHGDLLTENGRYYPCGSGPPVRLYTRHVNEKSVCHTGCRASDDVMAVRWRQGGVLITRRWPTTKVTFHPLPKAGCHAPR